MVLSSEEMSVLHGLINAAGNVSTYSYEVAVKGTVVEGLASLSISILTVIITVIIGKYMMTWAKNQHDDGAYAFAGFGVLITLVLTYGGLFLLLHGPIMSIGAPEYFVINKILSAAANAAT